MGVVWQARDETLGEDVALKFLPDAVRWDAGAFDDLKAETRRARQLTHPNIIRIHDFVEDAGGAAISMEWVDGYTLTEARLQKATKVFEPAEIEQWLPALCAALDYAHTQAKVVHRDLKPSNIMLTREGVVKVGDFGIARSLADSITRVSMMSAGTLVYMSPQQAMGEEPSASDDIYSLGATLYELLTGKPPFHTGDVRVQLFQRKPDSIAARRRALGLAETAGTAIPVTWEKTIGACLAKDIGERPATTGEVAARLNVPEPVRRKRLRRLTRRESVLAACAVAVLGWHALSPTRVFREKSPPAAAGFPSDATRALAAWNFDGDARDASGRGFDSHVGGAVPTTDRHGRIDHALRFNGNANVVFREHAALLRGGAQPFTVAFWIKLDAAAKGRSDIGGCLPDEVGALTWTLSRDEGRIGARLARVQVVEGAIELWTTAPLAADGWHHIAAVSDGRAWSLWLDGSLAATQPLGALRSAPGATRGVVMLGKSHPFSSAGFVGELDEARLWKRALSSDELAALARSDPAPRFAFTRATYSEKDDIAAAITAEFGPGAALADWEELRRWHADDARGWAIEIGLTVGNLLAMVARNGERFVEGKRQYFINRFDGTKPNYFKVHDELGGMTLALGSWYGARINVLARLPLAAPRRETLRASAATGVTRELSTEPNCTALSLSWRGRLVPERQNIVPHAELTLKDGRRLRAVCEVATDGSLSIALGSAERPEVSRQHGAGYGEMDFTLVAQDGRLKFRAVNVVGGAPLFQDEVSLAGFRARDVVRVSVPGVDAAELIIE